MNRWLFLIAALTCLGGCSEGANSSGSGGSSSSSASASSGGGEGGAGGGQPAALVPCLDAPDALPRPPSGKLPCEYIPPGKSLPQ